MPTVNEILKQKVITYFPSNRRMRISVFRTFFNELIDAITNQTQTILTTMVFLVGPKYKIGNKELLTPNKKQEDFNRWITDVNLAQYNEIQELKSKLACVMSHLGITCTGSGSSGSGSSAGGSGGIGGSLLEAWANAISFPVASSNTFFSGGVGFSNVLLTTFNGAALVKFEGFGFDSPTATSVEITVNGLTTPYFWPGAGNTGNGSSTVSLNLPGNILNVTSIKLSKGLYNNGLTNGQTVFTKN